MAIGLASIALLLFGKKRNIGGVIPDVVIQEVHDDAVTITVKRPPPGKDNAQT